MIQQKHIDAAEHYIAADKSDPFTRNRVYSHMRSALTGNRVSHGIAGYRQDNGDDAFYSASPETEMRYAVVDGREIEWPATGYRNIRRP